MLVSQSFQSPRAGWDAMFDHENTSNLFISIHPPRAGWD